MGAETMVWLGVIHWSVVADLWAGSRINNSCSRVVPVRQWPKMKTGSCSRGVLPGFPLVRKFLMNPRRVFIRVVWVRTMAMGSSLRETLKRFLIKSRHHA